LRKLDSFVKKYGPVEGPKMFSRLQREAALASAHARQKKAIKNQAAVELGTKGGKARAKNLSKEQLSTIGKKGAAKRWAKKQAKGGN
jgi:general stress protein YciG